MISGCTFTLRRRISLIENIWFCLLRLVVDSSSLIMEQKQYGLIQLPKQQKKPAATISRPSVFNESDSDDEDFKPGVPKASIQPTVKRQTKIDLNRALECDPTVFEYDSIYDEMKNERESVAVKKVQQKVGPKYMNVLIKKAEERKKEQERRMERKIQKEREQEGDEFADKEAFVTSAYKEKLEEMQKAEEEEQRQKAIEEQLDVTKQKDLSGFYRNLLNRNIVPDKDSKEESVTDIPATFNKTEKNRFEKKQRHLRVRNRSSSESSEEQIAETQNMDQVKDNNEEHKNNDDKECISVKKEELSDEDNLESKNEDESNEENNLPQNESKELDDLNENDEKNKISEEEPKVKKPKIDKMALLIEKFTKRTVGQVFDEAVERYLLRKKARLSVN